MWSRWLGGGDEGAGDGWEEVMRVEGMVGRR